MQVTVDLNELRKKRLMIATPMYGGMCHGGFTRSLMKTVTKANELGVHLAFHAIFNESLIQRARNYLVDEFLRSDCTHLIFIDADITFEADELFIMLNMMDEGSEYDIVCGAYPKKTISWEKIKRAVDKGAADEDPNNLSNYVGDFVFNPIIPQTGQNVVLDLSEPFRVREAGTGFMMISRKVFEQFKEAYPDKEYMPDHVRSNHFDGSRTIWAYFDCIIDPESKRYLSEDYYFCVMCDKIGVKTWMAPFVKLVHSGTYDFGGSLYHLAAVGADPTATTVGEAKAKK